MLNDSSRKSKYRYLKGEAQDMDIKQKLMYKKGKIKYRAAIKLITQILTQSMHFCINYPPELISNVHQIIPFSTLNLQNYFGIILPNQVILEYIA